MGRNLKYVNIIDTNNVQNLQMICLSNMDFFSVVEYSSSCTFDNK